MGEVYLARDLVLGRQVAIKVVSAAHTADPAANARLLREARAAATLDHAGICSVYDVQVDRDGRTYIVMQYVEGETLAQRLARGPLDVASALQLAAEVADALAVAHTNGIIHRDLKPQNIMLGAGGRPKLLDFGIAHVDVPPEAAAEIATHTATEDWSSGAIVGTPAYMSPEHVLRRPVDARSDLFSLGAVLFECLTGRPAFQATSDIETWGRVVYVAPPAPSSINPQVPAAADAVVSRLLAKEPAERFASASEAARALRAVPGIESAFEGRRRHRALTVAAVLFVAALGVTGWAGWMKWHTPPPQVAASPVIAVLPLDNLSADAALEYVGAGMAETMSTKLATLSGVTVVSRAEVHDARQRNADVPKLSRAMGLTYIVIGSVQQAAGRLHVTISLLGADGRTILPGAARIYEDALENVFELQRRIAEDLSLQIVGRLSGEQRAHLAQTPTTSVQAMSAYWRGRALMDKPGPQPIAPAIDAFGEAVAFDPTFALGYAGLGSAYWRKYVDTREPQWAAKAVEATERARQLDPDQADVRLALATVYNGLGRAADAIAEATRALTLQPGSYEAHRLLGDIHAARGEIDQAIAECLAAVRLRPDYPAGYRSLGTLLQRAGRYGDAVAAFERLVRLQPDAPFPYQLLGNAHLVSGDVEAAERDYSAALSRGGSFATRSSLGYVHYLRGRFDDAAAEFQKAIDLRPKSATTHWNLGDALRHAGRTADARTAYRQAVALFDADLRINGNDAGSRATRASCLARLGNMAAAQQEIARATSLSPSDQDVQYQRALLALMAGRTSDALDALDSAVAAGYSVPLLRLDQDLSALRGEPRFQALVGDGAVTRRVK
jgi:tetratricopeptide (TPR) repeat protein